MKKYLLIMVAMISMSFAQEEGDRSLSLSFGNNQGAGTSVGVDIDDLDTMPLQVVYGKFLSDSFMLTGGITGNLDELMTNLSIGLDYHFKDLGSGSMYALLNADKPNEGDTMMYLGVGYLMPLELSENMFLNFELSTDTEEIGDVFYLGGGITWIF